LRQMRSHRPAPISLLPRTKSCRLIGPAGSGSAKRSLFVVAVAQTPGGLTGAVLRVGSKMPQVAVRPRRALLGLGAASPLSDRHSERGPGFRRRLCATATVPCDRLRDVVGDFRIDDEGGARRAAGERAGAVLMIERRPSPNFGRHLFKGQL
jgi:hypothetical protein